MSRKTKKTQSVKNLSRDEIDNLAKDPENHGRQDGPYHGRGRWTASEVVSAVLLAESEDAALARLAQMNPSRIVLRLASLRLHESEAHAASAILLERHAQERGITLLSADGSGGGKKCPLPGESRVYSVQASRRGPKLYISLPVNCLDGMKPGGSVVAVFDEGTIRVSTG